MDSRRREEGQAAVELVALLPAIVLVAAVLWQVVTTGYAVWLAGSAARAAARAQAVGSDAGAAARRVLPAALERGLHVRRLDDGGVAVRVAVPAVVSGWRLGTVTASARFAPQAP